jgi:hypothetical protein
MKLKYGKITNDNTEYAGVDRIGDFGKDKDGFGFFYTKEGWRPQNPTSYELHYWKKKYQALKAKTTKK